MKPKNKKLVERIERLVEKKLQKKDLTYMGPIGKTNSVDTPPGNVYIKVSYSRMNRKSNKQKGLPFDTNEYFVDVYVGNEKIATVRFTDVLDEHHMWAEVTDEPSFE